MRAGLVKPAEAVKYPWSSLAKFPDKARADWLEPAVVLGEAGGLRDTPHGWKKYLQYLEFLAEDAPSQRALAAERMSRGWCVGGNEFKQEMKQELVARQAELERFAGLEPEQVRAERAELWEERLAGLARAAKIALGSLPARKSHPDKVRLAAAMKQRTSVPNGWLATRLGMGRPASVSQFVRRWHLQAQGQAATKALLSTVKT